MRLEIGMTNIKATIYFMLPRVGLLYHLLFSGRAEDSNDLHVCLAVRFILRLL